MAQLHLSYLKRKAVSVERSQCSGPHFLHPVDSELFNAYQNSSDNFRIRPTRACLCAAFVPFFPFPGLHIPKVRVRRSSALAHQSYDRKALAPKS